MEPDDAVLVTAALAGDRDAFAAIYDRYADRLHDFCWGILRDPDEAADATHDTFVRAAERLGQLRDPARLRAWLYAIARHEAFRRSRSRARMVPAGEETDMVSADAGPEELAGGRELAALVWAAAAGLDDRDRVLLDLSVRQGLDHDEVSLAVGVSAAHASVLLHRMRERVRRSLGALVLARSGARRDCPGLGRVLDGWDGQFSVRLRKRVARHAEQCEICGERLRGALDPLSLFGTVPALAAPAVLRDRVLGDAELVAHVERRGSGRGDRGTGGPGRGGSGPGRRPRAGERWRSGAPPPLRGTRRRRRLVTAAVLALLLLGGGSLAWGGAASRLPGEVATVASATPEGRARTVPVDAAPAPAPPTATREGPAQAEATVPATGQPSEVATESGVAPGAGETSAPARAPQPASGPPQAVPPPAPAVTSPAPAVTPPTPAATTAPPTPALPRGTQTPTPPPQPAGPRLALPVRALDLAADRVRASFAVANTGDAPLSWAATASATALTVTPATGRVAAGEGATVQVTLDRGGLPEGPFAMTVEVASDGGSGSVTVRGSVERPPVMGQVTVRPRAVYVAGSRCRPQEAIVSASWQDESPATAILHWSGAGGAGSEQMAVRGAQASAPLGPFPSAGMVELRVVVTDERGNAATSPTVTLTVQRCA